MYDKYKKYNPGDSRLFYGKKHRKKHKSKYWLDLQRTRPTDGIAHKLFAKMLSWARFANIPVVFTIPEPFATSEPTKIAAATSTMHPDCAMSN